jgi:hypothetical protein
LATCNNTRVQLDACIKYTRPIHASNWTRVLNTRVYLDACILYTCPTGEIIQLATMSRRHVANWTLVYSTRYCRHASNCKVFCSVSLHTNPNRVKWSTWHLCCYFPLCGHAFMSWSPPVYEAGSLVHPDSPHVITPTPFRG